MAHQRVPTGGIVVLQIIGWLGCVYLFVKGLELIAMAPRDENGKMHGAAISAIIVSILGAAVFVYLLKYQADDMAAQTAQSMSGAQSYADCLKDADTFDKVTACKPN